MKIIIIILLLEQLVILQKDVFEYFHIFEIILVYDLHNQVMKLKPIQKKK